MKPKIIFTILLLNISFRLMQAQTASELFVTLPEPALLPLTASDRLDLIDLYKSGGKSITKNQLGDSCSLLRMTDDYLQMQTGDNTIELFILPMINDSKVVGVIQTVCAPVCDSSLDFYTTTWKKLTTSVFIKLAGKNDFLKEGVQSEDEIVKNALIPLDISLMRLHYVPENHELQQYYTTPDYLSETDRVKAMSYLKDSPKVFKWNLTRFE